MEDRSGHRCKTWNIFSSGVASDASPEEECEQIVQLVGACVLDRHGSPPAVSSDPHRFAEAALELLHDGSHPATHRALLWLPGHVFGSELTHPPFRLSDGKMPRQDNLEPVLLSFERGQPHQGPRVPRA